MSFAVTLVADDEVIMNEQLVARRRFLRNAYYLGLYGVFAPLMPAWAVSGLSKKESTQEAQRAIELIIGPYSFGVNGRHGAGIAINNSIPGPLIRLKEGQDAVIKVTNHLQETTSIHWHGLILPFEMDGVPGVTFPGIQPGETFTYRFPVIQSGTYWCHSHSGGQELLGVYAPLIIDPKVPEPFQYDRDYIIVLSDWSFESPMRIIGKLKNSAGYYNYQKRTLGDFVDEVRAQGFSQSISERMMWGKMNMDPTDIADVTGQTYTYLMNGLPSAANWTGLFKRGERIRLRFIDAAAMTLFDVKIPGLRMTIVQSDGQNVQPVTVDEFRIAPGETYDVVVEPEDDKAYTLFAEAMDRSGYVYGTLSPRDGMRAPIPKIRQRPLRSMADMGMGAMAGMKMDGPGGQGIASTDAHAGHSSKKSNSMAGMVMDGSDTSDGVAMSEEGVSNNAPWAEPVKHAPDHHGIGNSAVAEYSRGRLHERGTGLESAEGKVLVYTDLKSITPGKDQRLPSREIELHVTGNMERYMWSFDGKKYSEDRAPIRFNFGERLRLTLVNDTMMEHPMHLHGMWMELENGHGIYQPKKHTIIIKPGERWSATISADALGKWAFHCHLLLHMEMGMFRVVEVTKFGEEGKV